MLSEVRKVARGWRWGRASPRPLSAPGPRVKSAAAYDTDWARNPTARIARGVIQELALLPALRLWAHPTVRGRERLEHLPQPAVVVANHVSHLDTSIIIDALPLAWRDRLAVGAAADYFFAGPSRAGVAALAIGAFPVERRRLSATSARLAVRLAEEGYNLILFPEGGRSEDGWLQELKPGAAYVAARTGRPLVPMWITGTEHLLPKGGRPRRGEVDILIGEPLVPYPREDPRHLHARLEGAMHRLAQEETTDWWTAVRGRGPETGGPPAARWRRIWARGAAPAPRRSRWP